MSKRAEEAAMKAYPEEITPLNYQELIDAFGGKTEVDFNLLPRLTFQQGFEQAEKDLELTWEDMRAIRIIADHLTASINGPMWDSKEFYEEILRRFNKAKEEKK